MGRVRLAIDGMGGDLGPGEIVKGAALAAKRLDVEVHVVGRPDVVKPLLGQHPHLHFVPAQDAIGMAEQPLRAVRTRKDASVNVCARLARDGIVDGWVSAGNSGATFAAALLVQGRVRGVERPSLGTVIPTLRRPTFFLDVGVNTDCRPQHLAQFAVMGAAYARAILGRESPRVALLSMDSKPASGSIQVQKSYELLIHSELNFVGCVAAPACFEGSVDVVVADGFLGNVAMKMAEAVASNVMHRLRVELTRSPLLMMGGLLLRSGAGALRSRFDWREYGGSAIVGVDGVAVVAHGRSDVLAIGSALRAAKEAVEAQLPARLTQALGASAHSATR